MGVTLEALWQKQVTGQVIFFEHATVCFIFLLKNAFSHFSHVCQRQINTINLCFVVPQISGGLMRIGLIWFALWPALPCPSWILMAAFQKYWQAESIPTEKFMDSDGVERFGCCTPSYQVENDRIQLEPTRARRWLLKVRCCPDFFDPNGTLGPERRCRYVALACFCDDVLI